jgi:hypothetical protein
VAFAMQTARVSVAWGGPRNIACLRRGALRSREPRQMSGPKHVLQMAQVWSRLADEIEVALRESAIGDAARE